MSIVFSSLQRIVVSRNPDGSYSWGGQYGGVDIKHAIPSDDGRRCVLLLDRDWGSANKRSTFENLVCIDQNGATIWVAKLPMTSDDFVTVQLTPEGLRATTWSGWSLLLDQETGAELGRTFVK